jgi:hypothetical protein
VLYHLYDSPHAQAHGGDLTVYYRQRYAEIKARWSQLGRDLITVIYKTIRMITFPIWFTRACILKVQAIRTRFTKPTVSV